MNDNNWIEWKWTPEKPYPETLETRVSVKIDMLDGAASVWPVKDWIWEKDGGITHYRIAED